MEISNYLVFFKKRNLFYKLILWKFRVYFNFAYFCEKSYTLLLYFFSPRIHPREDKAIIVNLC